eukprot:scaffold13279_cov155-Skeletonema_menzelii.AAC.7
MSVAMIEETSLTTTSSSPAVFDPTAEWTIIMVRKYGPPGQPSGTQDTLLLDNHRLERTGAVR